VSNKPAFNLYNLPYVLLVLTVLFWSGNFILGRAMRADVPPVALAFWRWTGASVIVMIFAWPHVRRDWPVLQRNWGILLLLAFLGVATFNTLVYTGLQWTIAINAFLLQSLMPVLIVLLSFLIFRERITGQQGIGILVSLTGAALIIIQGDPALLRTLEFNRGDLLVFVAVALYAGYSVMLRKRPALHPLSFLAATFVLGALMILPLYLHEHFNVRSLTLTGPALLTLAYVMVFPSILSYLFFNRGVELVGANRAGLFMHLMPVFGSILAVIFLGERFRWYHGVGIGLIAVGIWLATRRR
jgi:drug/metabolite transporter (DMT)-like permease